MIGSASLTLAERSAIGAGFALPRDAGLKAPTGRTGRRSCPGARLKTGVPGRGRASVGVAYRLTRRKLMAANIVRWPA